MTPSDLSATATVFAITGHRVFSATSAISKSIRVIFSKPSIINPVLLSPLAEGADRLAAHEILRLGNGSLQAVLPLQPEDYEADFHTAESRAEFSNLLSRATSTEVLPSQPTRADAYLSVGCHIVDKCDILLAVWDGLPAKGRGGTAEIVAYARQCGKPLIIIDSKNPTRITYERQDRVV